MRPCKIANRDIFTPYISSISNFWNKHPGLIAYDHICKWQYTHVEYVFLLWNHNQTEKNQQACSNSRSPKKEYLRMIITEEQSDIATHWLELLYSGNFSRDNKSRKLGRKNFKFDIGNSLPGKHDQIFTCFNKSRYSHFCESQIIDLHSEVVCFPKNTG